MTRNIKIVGLFLTLLLGIGVFWYLVSPLLLQKEVDDEFPFALMTQEEYDEMKEALTDIDMELPPLDDVLKMTDEDAQAMEKEIVEKSQNMEDVEVADEMDNSPTLLLKGTFEDADSFHKGAGDAYIYEIDGENLLRFENFTVTNGPDLRVLLSTEAMPIENGEG